MSIQFLHEFIDQTQAQCPDQIAIECYGEVTTYSQLHALAMAAAARLTALGISRHDVVMLDANKDVATVAALYGLSAIGAVVCPVPLATPASRKAYIANNSGAKLYLSTSMSDDWADVDSDTVQTHNFAVTDLKDTAPWDGRLSDLTADLLECDPVLLIYTSGTTANPKGICSLHSNVTFAVDAIVERLAYNRSDRILCLLPFSFDYGLYQIFLAAAGGSTCILTDDKESKIGITKLLRSSRATVLPAVAPIIEQLGLLVEKIGDFPDLRLITNTGAPIRAETLSKVRKKLSAASFQLMYGLTECKRASIADPDADIGKPGTCGTALPGTEIRIVNEEGSQLPANEVGEIVVRGPHVMAGYWNEPELTAEKFIATNAVLKRLHTGDLGYLDEDGELFCGGRMDDQFKQNGFRTSCSEIEAATLAIDGIDLAAVLTPGSVDRRLSVLFIQGSTDTDGVLATLANHLDDYKIPGACLAIDEMPLTGNGKIDKDALHQHL